MSTAAHIIVFSLLGLVPAPSAVLAMREAEFEVIEPEPPEEAPPEPEPEPPPPEPEPEVKPQRRAALPAPEPEPPKEQAPPPPEEIADFTGQTLTADGAGASWSTVVGSGAPLRGPVGKIGRTAEPVQQAAKTAPVGPRFVPVGSLARKPSAPAGLDDLLRKNYPRRAAMQGVAGRARVMMRLMPTGRPTNLRLLEESPQGYGFGEACMKLLREASAFSPAFDRDGNAVATEIPFSCSFEIDD